MELDRYVARTAVEAGDGLIGVIAHGDKRWWFSGRIELSDCRNGQPFLVGGAQGLVLCGMSYRLTMVEQMAASTPIELHGLLMRTLGPDAPSPATEVWVWGLRPGSASEPVRFALAFRGYQVEGASKVWELGLSRNDPTWTESELRAAITLSGAGRRRT